MDNSISDQIDELRDQTTACGGVDKVRTLVEMQASCGFNGLKTAAWIWDLRLLAVDKDSSSMIENPSQWAPNDVFECARRHADSSRNGQSAFLW
jgi:hypothetical protein